MNSNKYELRFGYLHCAGKTSYTAGFVDSEREAEDWMKENRLSGKKNIRPPKEDPIRWCPVRNCHLKRQAPQVSYRPVASDG